MHSKETREHQRLAQKALPPTETPPWQRWGPYVSERAWGTVREDYSADGNAWNFFPFEDAHKRVFRWGDDGIAGFCDRYQILLLAPAFWNGKDPILKERLFGLASLEGNHGEDVKEIYYHLDGLPSHAYMKYLYKYPHEEFPYALLKQHNAQRSTKDREFEITDTGIFNQQKYFDIFIEYAKVTPEDFCVKIEAFNRADTPAELHILPQLWFRNQWSWKDTPMPAPQISYYSTENQLPCLFADDSLLQPLSNLTFEYKIGKRYLYGSEGANAIFTNNSNHIAGNFYFKDGFHRAIIKGEKTINPEKIGTKAALHYHFKAVAPKSSVAIYLRFSPEALSNPLEGIEEMISKRKEECDEFYRSIHPPKASEKEKAVQRQALAGILWSKQFYYFEVDTWMKGDNTILPPPAHRKKLRNFHWRHLNSMRILCMPDKWEYPWFAGWDLAFHCITMGLIDLDFAKEQLWLLLFDQFQHPNGAIPAYEWEFSDLNPPVQAWSALTLYEMGKKKGVEDREFLKRCFLKLILNFAYWVNRVDKNDCNVFEGGFLGLDNITIFDRSKTFDSEGTLLKQADGSGWMAMFSLNLMRIALILSKEDKTYEEMATKFFQHFVYIGHAIHKSGDKNYELWSEEDGFFNDILVYPYGKCEKFRVHSFVGLIPLYAVDILSQEELEEYPTFKRDFLWFLKNRPIHSAESVIPIQNGEKKYYALSLVDENRLKRLMHKLWSPEEFRSEFGLRSLSKIHQQQPFSFARMQVGYEPGESSDRLKGGNSNWRGPIWFPTNYLMITVLKKYSFLFQNNFCVEIPNEKPISMENIAHSLADRLITLFIHPHYGGSESIYQNDPNFTPYTLFYEYYHAETGEGLGASHQTGWTALVANLIDEFRN